MGLGISGASVTAAYNNQRRKTADTSSNGNQKPLKSASGNKQRKEGYHVPKATIDRMANERVNQFLQDSGTSETMQQRLAYIEESFGAKLPKPTGYSAGTKFTSKATAGGRGARGLDFFIPSATASENFDSRTARGTKAYQRNVCIASTEISEDAVWPTKAMLRSIPYKSAGTTYDRKTHQEHRRKEIEKILAKHYELRGQ